MEMIVKIGDFLISNLNFDDQENYRLYEVSNIFNTIIEYNKEKNLIRLIKDKYTYYLHGKYENCCTIDFFEKRLGWNSEFILKVFEDKEMETVVLDNAGLSPEFYRMIMNNRFYKIDIDKLNFTEFFYFCDSFFFYLHLRRHKYYDEDYLCLNRILSDQRILHRKNNECALSLIKIIMHRASVKKALANTIFSQKLKWDEINKEELENFINMKSSVYLMEIL